MNLWWGITNHNVNVDIHQLVLHACDFACPVQRPGHSFIATNASTQKLKVSCFDVLYINIYKALFRPFQIATSHNFQTLCIYIYLPERILGPPSSRGNVGSYLLANKGRSEFLEDWFNHVQCSIPTRCINTFSFSLRSTHKV
jgi:hypothetical protein